MLSGEDPGVPSEVSVGLLHSVAFAWLTSWAPPAPRELQPDTWDVPTPSFPPSDPRPPCMWFLPPSLGLMALESIHFSPVPPLVLATLSLVPTSKVFQASGLNFLQVSYSKAWNLILPLLYLPLMMVSPHLSRPWARLIRSPSSSSFSSHSPATSQVPRWAPLSSQRTHTLSHLWSLHSWSLTYKRFPVSPATLASAYITFS